MICNKGQLFNTFNSSIPALIQMNSDYLIVFSQYTSEMKIYQLLPTNIDGWILIVK